MRIGMLRILGLFTGFLILREHQAFALPSFAAQTGQPCVTCHVGGFGPQLTPFGRAFKIGGYTQGGGEGPAAHIPLAAMALGSFNRSSTPVPQDQIQPHFAANNNFALDQVSAFLAGRLGPNTGAFVQFTYSNIPNASHLDNVDLRPYTTELDIGSHALLVGASVNNNPTVQDPYNSTYAWGFPFAQSGLAPSPAASPVLASGFNNNALGYSAYLWLDRSLYIEAGLYTTLGSWTLARIGDDFGVGGSRGVMPYLRAAYEWNWNGQSAHVGAIYLQSNVNPVSGPFRTDGSAGQDHYRDYAVDAGYQYLGDGTHIVTAESILTHESQNLEGTTGLYNLANGTSLAPHASLNELRVALSYWYRNTYGATFAWQRLWGPANPVLFASAPLTGSANGRPDTNAFTLEIDWVPFGKDSSWAKPFANLKLGAQYTNYTEFNGGSTNYDGFGRNASANNTLFIYAWMAF